MFTYGIRGKELITIPTPHGSKVMRKRRKANKVAKLARRRNRRST